MTSKYATKDEVALFVSVMMLVSVFASLMIWSIHYSLNQSSSTDLTEGAEWVCVEWNETPWDSAYIHDYKLNTINEQCITKYSKYKNSEWIDIVINSSCISSLKNIIVTFHRENNNSCTAKILCKGDGCDKITNALGRQPKGGG